MKELKLINPENATEEEIKSYRVREATRAVVVDREGLIALLHVSKASYYKLPGGGIDHGENELAALDRECREEIGCAIDVIDEVGRIVEYRKIFSLKQISYCYLAKVKGEKETPSFTDEEVKDGFKEVWLTYEDAKRALSESRATTFEGAAYIVPRDMVFLEEAKGRFGSLHQ